jgi:acyl-CoA dehydrogenase
MGMAVCYEEMNRSIFGPVVFNSAAPDDGNMMVLEQAATPEQKARWLAPIVAGDVRSAFAMTEPHPGGGSDPGMMLTTATRKGDRYVIQGRKWFITGAAEARHFIRIARTSDDPRRGLTAFMFHRDQPGWRIVRRIPIMGPEEHGGHCEIEFDGLEVPRENLLMGEGDGLKLTQIRLGTARLTHCMRWQGLADRALDMCREYLVTRTSFGKTLAHHQLIQKKVADAVSGIHAGHPQPGGHGLRLHPAHEQRMQLEERLGEVRVRIVGRLDPVLPGIGGVVYLHRVVDAYLGYVHQLPP